MGPLRISRRTHHTGFAPLLARIADGNVFRVVEQAPGVIEPDPYLSDYGSTAAPLGGVPRRFKVVGQ
jgi:hypothetical protein